MKKTKFIAVILLTFFLPACTTAESLLTERGKGGKVFVCQAGYDRAYQATLSVMRTRHLKVIRKDKKQGYILASDTIRFLNGGGRVAVYLYELEPSKTQIEIQSKPYFFIPTPTIYWAAKRRASSLEKDIRAALAAG